MTIRKLKPGQELGELRVVAELENDFAESYRMRDVDGNDAELLLLPADEDLERRAGNLAGFHHENIIAVNEAGRWEGASYIVRELVTGWTVAGWIGREGKLHYDEALGIACQLCLASTAAEKSEAGPLLFHPETVLVQSDGFARADPLRLALRGEDAYRSPEEVSRREPDSRSDVFRIALITYHMISGRLPQRDGFGRVGIEPLTAADGNLPGVLDEVLSKALSFDPEERHADADALLDQLHELLMKRPSPAAMGPARWFEDRRFWLYTAIALAALAGLLAVIFGFPIIPLG